MTQPTTSIPTYVIAGFLGAGKTTLINSILQHTDEPIAVVVNDFGAINIDASLIESQIEDVIELTNGCVCCSIGESLADALYAILDRDTRPNSIIIEASGVADPEKISAYTHLHGLHNAGTIVLVDAVLAEEHNKNQRVKRTFRRQISTADLLAITKTELSTPDLVDETMLLIREIAPHTPTMTARPEILSHVFISQHQYDSSTSTHDAFHSFVMQSTSFSDETQLRDELTRLPERTVRAKGVVSIDNGDRRLVQLVGKHLAITATTSDVTGIVVIHTD